MAEEEAYDPFYKVRKGGPKEKRLRRVELMGEHSPKPIYYIKVTQSPDDVYLTEDTLRGFFESSIGKVGDVYRPVDSSSNLKEFVLVGFYDAAEAKAAVSQIKSTQYIGSVAVTADEAKPWLLDLYPR